MSKLSKEEAALTCIILAGGKSSRMQQDKGLVLLNGKMMIAHILDKVRTLTQNIIIITQNNDYQQFNEILLNDVVANCGPMGGILTGLLASTSQKNLVLSCDIPFISVFILEKLIANCKEENVLAATHEGRVEPLCAVYDKSCIPFFSESIDNQELKMMFALEKLNAKYLDFTEFKDDFRNINTPKDLAQNNSDYDR